MEEPRTPMPFWRAIPRRAYLIAVVSAVLLGVAAVTSILLKGASTPATVHTASIAGAADTALSTAGDASGADPQAAPTETTPAPPNPAQTKSAKTKPAQPKSAQPKSAEPKPAQAKPAETKAAPKPPSEKVLNYDFQYQSNSYYCGPASVRIALSTEGFYLSQDGLARQLGTGFNGTNSAEDTTRVMNDVVGKTVYHTRSIPGPGATPAQMDRLQADVVNAISNGRGLVANIVGGATDNAGYWRDFSGGHYVAIVGYSDQGRQVQIADPSGFGPSSYWISTIKMTQWMASRGYSA